MNIGLFINSLVSFTIVAFAIFMLVKAINRLKREAPAEAARSSDQGMPYCLSSVPLKASRCPCCIATGLNAAAGRQIKEARGPLFSCWLVIQRVVLFSRPAASSRLLGSKPSRNAPSGGHPENRQGQFGQDFTGIPHIGMQQEGLGIACRFQPGRISKHALVATVYQIFLFIAAQGWLYQLLWVGA
jgi:hypothetical protein